MLFQISFIILLSPKAFQKKLLCLLSPILFFDLKQQCLLLFAFTEDEEADDEGVKGGNNLPSFLHDFFDCFLPSLITFVIFSMDEGRKKGRRLESLHF